MNSYNVAHFPLAARPAFVVRTGLRFRLTPSVAPYFVDDSLCKRAQHCDSATLGFGLGAQHLWLGRRRAEIFLKVCAEMSQSSRLRIEPVKVDLRWNCTRDDSHYETLNLEIGDPVANVGRGRWATLAVRRNNSQSCPLAAEDKS